MGSEANQLLNQIRGLILAARGMASRSVDTIQVLTNFEIGRRIVEDEQKGARRAKYGQQVLKELSESLMKEFGKGFSLTNLKLMRKFYTMNQERIGRTPPSLLPSFGISQTLSDQLSQPEADDISWHHTLQEETRRAGGNNPSPRCQYPCQGISALPAIQGGAEAKTPGVGCRR